MMRHLKTQLVLGCCGSLMLIGSCGLSDIGMNIVKGTLDFVAEYTEDVFFGVAPTPPDVFE